MSQPPRVSIIIPTLNRARFISGAIESVLAQTYPSWELLIVDNGSTDETESIARSFATKDSRVHYLQENRKGVSRARNLALKTARGEYIAFLDDDDLYLPSKLQLQVSFMDAHPETGFVYGQIEIVNSKDELQWVDPKKPVLTYRDLFEESGIRIQSVMCRRSCFDAVGGFDEGLTMGEDYDLWLRMAAVYSFEFMAVPLVRMRFHESNTCNVPVPLYKQRDQLLRRVPVNPSAGITRRVKQRRLAHNLYRLARIQRDQDEMKAASLCFLKSFFEYPKIGVVVAGKEESFKNVFSYSTIKPLLAAVYCLLASMRRQRRKYA